jgi:hypothetical protein
VTQPVAKAGKKVLATDTAQGVIGAAVDKMEEIAVDEADDAAETLKEKARESRWSQARDRAQGHHAQGTCKEGIQNGPAA